MPKVSVYLSDELYRRAKERDLKLSSLTQAAVEHALAEGTNAEWIREVSRRPARLDREVDTAALLDEVREESGA